MVILEPICCAKCIFGSGKRNCNLDRHDNRMFCTNGNITKNQVSSVSVTVGHSCNYFIEGETQSPRPYGFSEEFLSRHGINPPLPGTIHEYDPSVERSPFSPTPNWSRVESAADIEAIRRASNGDRTVQNPAEGDPIPARRDGEFFSDWNRRVEEHHRREEQERNTQEAMNIRPLETTIGPPDYTPVATRESLIKDLVNNGVEISDLPIMYNWDNIPF